MSTDEAGKGRPVERNPGVPSEESVMADHAAFASTPHDDMCVLIRNSHPAVRGYLTMQARWIIELYTRADKRVPHYLEAHEMMVRGALSILANGMEYPEPQDGEE